MNTQEKLQAIVQTFVKEVQNLVAEAAREQLLAALGGDVLPTLSSKRATRGAAKTPKAQKAAKPGKRIRRSPEELAELEGRIVKVLTASPKLTSEEIQDKLKLTKAQLQLPLTEMRDKGLLKTVGERRGMRYFVAGASGAPAKKSAK